MEFNLDVSPPPLPQGTRRRSTLLERRTSAVAFFPHTEHQNNGNNEISEQEKASIKRNIEVKKIERHIEKLSAEKNAWRKKYQETHKAYAQLYSKVKEKKVVERSLDSCYALLSDEDMKFLQNRPDLDKIQEDAQQLCKEVLHTLEIKKALDNQAERFLDFVSEEANTIQEFILDHSTVKKR